MGNKKESPKELNLTGLSGKAAMLAELKYAQSDEGKAEKARKKAETAAKKEAQQIEKEVSPQKQSRTDFFNLTFTPPKRDILEMMTPSKEKNSTAWIPYRENKSLLDFIAGGSPSKQKTAQDIKEEKMKARLSELKEKKN